MTVAAIGAAVLLGLVGVFQFRLASGAPFGDMAYGGRVPTANGVLPMPYRIASAVAVPILFYGAWLVLAAADVVNRGSLSDGLLGVAVWIVFGYLALNTLGNLASQSRRERIVFAPISGVAAVLTLIVALASQ